MLLAVFTPWSAINLVDYYCFTRSRYDVPALSDPNGRYGRWNATGIIMYLTGILVQIPFLSTSFTPARWWLRSAAPMSRGWSVWSCRRFVLCVCTCLAPTCPGATGVADLTALCRAPPASTGSQSANAASDRTHGLVLRGSRSRTLQDPLTKRLRHRIHVLEYLYRPLALPVLWVRELCRWKQRLGGR